MRVMAAFASKVKRTTQVTPDNAAGHSVPRPRMSDVVRHQNSKLTVDALIDMVVRTGQTVAAFLGTTGATTLLAPVVVGAAAFAKGYQLGNSEKVRIRRMIASLQHIDKSGMTREKKDAAMLQVLKNASAGQSQAPASDPGGAEATVRRRQPLQTSIDEATKDLTASLQVLESTPGDDYAQGIVKAQAEKLGRLARQQNTPNVNTFTKPVTQPTAKLPAPDAAATYLGFYNKARGTFTQVEQENHAQITARRQQLQALSLKGREPEGASKAYNEVDSTFQSWQRHLARTSQLAALKGVMQTYNLRSIKDP
jgi:hypothetical protein